MEADRSENYDDLGEGDMRRYDQIYSGKKRRNAFSKEVMDDFEVLFKKNMLSSTSVDNDYALLEDRCITVKKKQLKNIENVLSQRKLLIKELGLQQEVMINMERDVEKLKRSILSKNC